MRKFVKLIALAVATSLVVMPVSVSVAGEGYWYYHKKKKVSVEKHGTNHTGPWIVACFGAAAVGEMVGTAVLANDKNDPRQLTINEAGWVASACPLLLPWALLVQATCPDNKATKEIARQAFRYGRKFGVVDWTPFTNAYTEACRKGTLSADFRAFLKSKNMRLSSAAP